VASCDDVAVLRGLLVFFAVGALFAPGAARAQSAAQKAAAQALFDEGVRLMEAGNYGAACAKLEASLSRVDGVGTRGKLAQCYEKTSRFASAWGMWREVAVLAARAGQEQRRAFAEKRAADLEKQLSYVTVAVASEAPVPGLTIERDGVVVLPGEYGTAVVADAGTVSITATAPGHESWTGSIELGVAARETVVVPRLALKGTEPSGADESASAPSPAVAYADRPPTTDRTAEWVLAGVGGASIATGAVFGILALGDNASADDFCDDNDACTPEGAEKRDAAQSKALVSDVALGLGIAAIGAAAILYFSTPDPAGDGSAVVTPAVTAHGVGVAVSGRF